MNSWDEKEIQADFQGEADATLRLIASLPVPEGLAERVRGGLHSGTLREGARVLSWPKTARAGIVWLRGAAAAAIVCVVAGGAWWISAKAPAAGGSAAAAPVHVRPAGGFSNASAMHTPDTLKGPVLKKQGTENRDQGTKGQRDQGVSVPKDLKSPR
jgi:hypothetical protein